MQVVVGKGIATVLLILLPRVIDLLLYHQHEVGVCQSSVPRLPSSSSSSLFFFLSLDADGFFSGRAVVSG